MIRNVKLVRCDTCPDSEFLPPGNAWTAAETRREAAASGWTRHREPAAPGTPATYLDICPDCENGNDT